MATDTAAADDAAAADDSDAWDVDVEELRRLDKHISEHEHEAIMARWHLRAASVGVTR